MDMKEQYLLALSQPSWMSVGQVGMPVVRQTLHIQYRTVHSTPGEMVDNTYRFLPQSHENSS